MKGPILEVDAQRARWATYRKKLSMGEPAGDDFALGGLGCLVEDLDVRLLFLPSDPLSDLVPLSRETLDWLKEQKESPYGGALPDWGHRTHAASIALLVYEQHRDDQGWDRYLALHRHGGVEVGSGRSVYEVQGSRIFALLQMVALSWSALAVQDEAIQRWSLKPPFEFTIALRKTKGATLGGFAEGWLEPGQGLARVAKCLEDHVLLRWEFEAQPVVEELALEVGDRIEQAFGTTHRRHLAERGEYEGQFDPRVRF